ncbi:hypothetical protein JCM10908_003355 [Rhodotorula pacifica]|uniref:uncharacterized protein n=1 Tax=Rhodotorula pacifica TaxID=1495444 RepID=UPI00316FCAB7
MASQPQMGPIELLPTELVTVILAFATRDGRRRSVLHKLALVSPAFADAARLLSTRSPALFSRSDAQGFLNALRRDPSPARRSAAVRYLQITYATRPASAAPDAGRRDAAANGNVVSAPALLDGDIDDANQQQQRQEREREIQQDPITVDLAIPILYFLDRLVSLEIKSDDGLALLEAVLQARTISGGGGGGMTRLERFSANQVRWDRLVRLLEPARGLTDLKLDGLYYSAEPEEEDGAVAVAEDDDDDDAADTAPIPAASDPVAASNESPNRGIALTVDVASSGLASPDRPLLSHLHYTTSLPALLEPLPFPPLMPLKSLHLHRFEAPDEGPLISLLASCSSTLDTLILSETTSISRYGLVAALRMLPTLSELEVTKCRFFPERIGRGGGAGGGPPGGPLGAGGGGGGGAILTRQMYLVQVQRQQAQQAAQAIQQQQRLAPVLRARPVLHPAPAPPPPPPSFNNNIPPVLVLAPPAVPAAGFAPFGSTPPVTFFNNNGAGASSSSSSPLFAPAGTSITSASSLRPAPALTPNNNPSTSSNGIAAAGAAGTADQQPSGRPSSFMDYTATIPAQISFAAAGAPPNVPNGPFSQFVLPGPQPAMISTTTAGTNGANAAAGGGGGGATIWPVPPQAPPPPPLPRRQARIRPPRAQQFLPPFGAPRLVAPPSVVVGGGGQGGSAPAPPPPAAAPPAAPPPPPPPPARLPAAAAAANRAAVPSPGPSATMVVLPTSIGDESDSDRRINASLNLLEPGSPSRRALLDPISSSAFLYPLDHLHAYCPFLHVLTLNETDQVLSPKGVETVLGALPLERAVMGWRNPRVPVLAVEAGLKASKGRLDAITITVGMRWSQKQLDTLRNSPAAAGVIVDGQAYAVPEMADPYADLLI